MPIEVTCEECFTPHRVKSEYAGRRFKCRECGSPLVVPRKTSAPAAAAPPPVARAPQRTGKQRPRKSKSGSKSKASGWLTGPKGWIIGGAALLVLLMILVPPVLHIMVFPLVLAGIALTLWGGLKCLFAAFEEDVSCGLLYLFVPFYNLFYVITRWDTVGRYFLTALGGILLMWGPMFGLKVMTDARWAEDEQEFNEIVQAENALEQGDPATSFPEPGFADDAATLGDTDDAMAAEDPPGRPGGFGPNRGGRRPPPASVLDGRPEPLSRPPESAERVHPQRNPVEPGSKVWITDQGRWYPGTVAELTDSPAQYLVNFEGWEDRPPMEVNIAWMRHRTEASDSPPE